MMKKYFFAIVLGILALLFSISVDCVAQSLQGRRGMMDKSGDAMACVPKGITVEITGGRAVDGISY